MKSFIFYLSTIVFINSCQPHSIAIKNPPPVETAKLTSNSPIKPTWDYLMALIFKQGYTITSRDEKAGVLNLKIENATLTTLTKSGAPENKNAFAFTEEIRKGSNPDHLFARKGVIEFNLLMQPSGEKTDIFVRCINKGTLTEYYQNGFTVRKLIRDINIWSTGVFEKMIMESIKG